MRCILCNHKEYRLNDGEWCLHTQSKYEVNLNFIDNMVEAYKYFTSLGGYMDIDWKSTKFGYVVSKVISISSCGQVKKILDFSYR